MASGSKKSRAGTPPETPPELRPWQILVLDAVAASPLSAEVTLGGGTALAAVYLHHRVSEDLDFFAMREIEHLYFLLREGVERDLGRLLALVRAKFDVGADALTLAERLLHFADIPPDQLPPLLRPVPIDDLRAFFEDLARRLVRGA